MSYIRLLDEKSINSGKLTNKKEQTRYKIKLVSQYIILWLYVFRNNPKIYRINFIDAMCNAGIYDDGELSTAMEVLLIFCREAKSNTKKEFHIFLNDNDSGKIQICKKIANALLAENGQPPNVILHFSARDVNDYLTDYNQFDKITRNHAATVFFIDPYDMGTVIVDNISNLVKRYYCEIIFNVITSDFVRNGIDERIKKCIGRNDITNKEDLMEHIADKLKVGCIKHSFAYQFNNSRNTEIYQIFYATPHPEGLKKLKDVIWKTFSGSEFFRTSNQVEGQIPLFSDNEVQETQSEYFARNARQLLVKEFSGRTIDYQDIALFLLERTLLKSSDFISKVIKPLIKNGIINKMNLKGKINYKEDSYKFSRENETN